MRPSLPLEPGPDLVTEEVTGWRGWRLHRGPDGALILRSIFMGEAWPARTPLCARCDRSGSTSRPPHRAPDERCSCGIYAAASFGRLRTAGVTSGGTLGVLGTVSMWGRVVEHVGGYRAELAYPSRLRLVCPRCLAEARSPVPEVLMQQGDVLIPVCRAHERFVGGRPAPVSPAAIQAELLSRYAVDLLPLEATRIPRISRWVPEPVRGLGRQARREARQLARSWVGWIGGLVLTFLAWNGLRGGAAPAPVDPTPTASSVPASSASPLPGTGDPVRSALGEPDGPGGHRDVFRFAVVCGRLEGDLVALVPCRARSGVWGFAVSPPETRGGCGMDAYTRKGSFSVCWMSLDGPIHPYPHPAILRMPGVRFDDVFRSDRVERG